MQKKIAIAGIMVGLTVATADANTINSTLLESKGASKSYQVSNEPLKEFESDDELYQTQPIRHRHGDGKGNGDSVRQDEEYMRYLDSMMQSSSY